MSDMIYSRPPQYTVAECPEGGFMVYSDAERDRMFQGQLHLVPIAGFSQLRAALEFIENKMRPTKGEPDA